MREAVYKNYDSLSNKELVGIVQSGSGKMKLDTTALVGRIFNGQSKKSKEIFGIAYPQIIQNYMTRARHMGANLIKINQLKYAQVKGENDEIDASFFKVNDIRNYETRIYWSPDRKLTWEDFKGHIPDEFKDENYSSYGNVGIQHRTNMEKFYGTPNFFVIASFDCEKSWFRPYAYYQNDFLSFQQGLFDLTELYARKMQTQFTTNKKKGNRTIVIKALDDSLGEAYKKAENEYVTETNAGGDKEALTRWRLKIRNELGL
ncbi:hypothetical protein [Rhizosphaericola mali]|uniref:Uncharacterized protein n=1 Tax=Rhizosphaericola mali TaxID=2545455 RepID=A0A5P2FW13_9BACT|nr:hypothetical protein [Rhizosphaericola mali]QES87704.1 hypothetical protein E0W69_003165 [Rhizosphaericola mali]